MTRRNGGHPARGKVLAREADSVPARRVRSWWCEDCQATHRSRRCDECSAAKGELVYHRISER